MKYSYRVREAIFAVGDVEMILTLSRIFPLFYKYGNAPTIVIAELDINI